MVVCYFSGMYLSNERLRQGDLNKRRSNVHLIPPCFFIALENVTRTETLLKCLVSFSSTVELGGACFLGQVLESGVIWGEVGV